jgi:pyruvate dehydrogenase E2 component (dihydrolipoamide acetyltransferase)
MYEVIMPKMGETMEAGTIEKWRKKEGDKVEKGEILYDLTTDKVTLEVESFFSGYLKKIVRHEGEEVPIMEIIAYIGEKDEPLPENAEASKAQPVKNIVENKQAETEKKTALEDTGKTTSLITQPSEIETKAKEISISPIAKNIAQKYNIDITKLKGTGPSGRIVKEDVEKAIAEGLSAKSQESQITNTQRTERLFISPFARKIASDLGIDIKTAAINGTGPNGRIISKDVISFSKSSQALKIQPQPSYFEEKQFAGEEAKKEEIPSTIKVLSSTTLKGVRKVISERMLQSAQNIPHILLYSVCDVASLINLREKIKPEIEQKYNLKITFTDFFVKICAIALNEYRVVNASLQNDNHIIYDDINIGIGVAVPSSNTLVVPTIFNADKKGILEIAQKRSELVEKARNGKLSLEEMSNATFTITNLGMYGIRSFTAIINPPQGAIMMVSEMYETPVARNGKIEISTCMEIGVAVDHRIIDGALAAQFLQRARELIENPEMLIL